MMLCSGLFLTSWSRGFSPTEDMIATHTMPRSMSSVALHPNGDRFVAGSDSDPWVRIYDALTASEKGKYYI